MRSKEKVIESSQLAGYGGLKKDEGRSKRLEGFVVRSENYLIALSRGHAGGTAPDERFAMRITIRAAHSASARKGLD